MSDDDLTLPPIEQPSELELLKQKAALMGIKHHPSIGLEKLQAKIDAHVEESSQPLKITLTDTAKEEANDVLKEQRIRRKARKKEMLKLVRVRVTPMNPHMRGLKGQMFGVSNRLIGKVYKYIPFNSPHGWHIPQVLLDEMQSKEYLTITEVTTPTGKVTKRKSMTKAYAIEIMAPLTPEEAQGIQSKIALTEGQEDY